jgi:hypothetical protein
MGAILAPSPEKRAWGYAGPACPHCARPIEVQKLVSGAQTCPWCRRPYEAVVFDPPPPDLSVPRLAEAGPEATHACANHAGNVAVTHCTRCGIFMCALCRIHADAMVLCPACFDRLVAEGALPSAIATYRDHGRQATMLVLMGILIIVVAPIAGPAAIYYARKQLKQLTAMKQEGGRAAMYVVQILAVLEALFGMLVLYYMVKG